MSAEKVIKLWFFPIGALTSAQTTMTEQHSYNLLDLVATYSTQTTVRCNLIATLLYGNLVFIHPLWLYGNLICIQILWLYHILVCA